jgi:2-iminobutanoate/2-iminopropanoate deaminase
LVAIPAVVDVRRDLLSKVIPCRFRNNLRLREPVLQSDVPLRWLIISSCGENLNTSVSITWENDMTVQRKGFQPEGLMKRVVGGHTLYWHSLSISGGQRQIFISGQVPRDREGNVVGKGDMAAQIDQVGKNLKMCLEAAGATLADLVRTTTYTTQIDEFFKNADVRMRYFGPAMPASTTVEVRRLAHVDFMVEIDALAIV